MKELRFTTSKGEFLVVDIPTHEEIEKELEIFGHDIGLTNEDLNNYFKHILPDFNNSYDVSEITESEASDIVSSLVKNENGIKSYVYTLQKLLKTKGIYLYENPLQVAYQFDQSVYEYHKTEQKTFYNPYIFKL